MSEWYVLGLLGVKSVKGGVNIVIVGGRVGTWVERDKEECLS